MDEEEVGIKFHEAELKTCKNAKVVLWLYEQLRQSVKKLNMGCSGGCREFNIDVYSDKRFKCKKCEDTKCKVTPVAWNDEEIENDISWRQNFSPLLVGSQIETTGLCISI